MQRFILTLGVDKWKIQWLHNLTDQFLPHGRNRCLFPVKNGRLGAISIAIRVVPVLVKNQAWDPLALFRMWVLLRHLPKRCRLNPLCWVRHGHPSMMLAGGWELRTGQLRSNFMKVQLYPLHIWAANQMSYYIILIRVFVYIYIYIYSYEGTSMIYSYMYTCTEAWMHHQR